MSATNPCPYCGVNPGQPHEYGCDIEHCRRCGRQAIGCNCIYESCGMDPTRLEQEHPDIYANGPTDEMYARWDAEWESHRLHWTGEFPGSAECREFGWFCKWIDGVGYIPCDPRDPDATEDLNRLVSEGRWDADAGRWRKR